jgi:hypothetical protein
MEKRDPIRHSKLPVEAKWITTDEIIAFRKLKLKSNWRSILRARKLGAYRIDEIHLQWK